MGGHEPRRQDPFGGTALGLRHRVLIYFGLADDPREPVTAAGTPPGSEILQRLESIERRLAEQERTLGAIHDLLRRDAGR